MKFFYIAIVLLVAACSSPPSVDEVAMAIAQTQIAMPTNSVVSSPTSTSTPEPTTTPIPIPFSEVDLESILLKPGDLPAGFSGGQVNDNPSEAYSVPMPDQYISQEFVQNAMSKVGVVVILFTNEDDATQAYKNISIKAKEAISNIGDRADGAFSDTEIAGMVIHVTTLEFIRCYSVVYIYGVSESVDRKVASIYAQRLDERLIPLVCR